MQSTLSWPIHVVPVCAPGWQREVRLQPEPRRTELAMAMHTSHMHVSSCTPPFCSTERVFAAPAAPAVPALPCSGHFFINQGIGGTTSTIFMACVEQLVPPVRLPW